MLQRRASRIRLRRFVSLLTTSLLAATGLGALQPLPSYAETAATFANTSAIQGRIAYGDGQSSTPITVSASGTPTGSVYPSTIHVSGAAGNVASLSIGLDLNHTAPDDLDVLLVSPTGRTVVLMSDTGGYADWDGLIRFSSDGNAVPMPDTTTFSDTFPYQATNYVGNDGIDVWPAPAPSVADPNASLSTLSGDAANGDWKLFVHDDQDQDGGAITSWSIVIATDAVPTMAATYPSGLSVSGLTGVVSDVDLTLNGVSSRDMNMLDVMLVAPDGRRALVLSDVGGYYDVSDLTLTLDDQAGGPLSADTPPTSGSYRPTNIGSGDSFPAPAPDPSTAGAPLATFDGADPNGTWTLYVVQDEIDNTPESISAGWSLRITTSPTSPQIISTTPGSHAVGVRRGANITAGASKNLRLSSVTGKTVYLTRAGSSRHVAATIRYFEGTRTIVIDPRHRLAADTRYRVTVTTGVRDTTGHQLDQDPTRAGLQAKTWRFRTRG